jgi:O-methyltransferase
MSNLHQDHHDKQSRASAKRLSGGLRRVYKAVIPKEVRRWRAKAWLFVSDRELYAVDRERYRRYAAQQRAQADFFRRAFSLLTVNGISGDYLEFGVAWGNSFAHAFHAARSAGHAARLWAFDSFEGLPASDDPRDNHPAWKAGNFAVSLDKFLKRCVTEKIPRNRFEIVPGLFSDSLAPSSPGYDRLPKDIAFAYVDCDMYTSTKSVLNFLAPRLKHGMVLAFDDYFNLSSSALAGTRRAFLELQKEALQFNFLPYIQFGMTGKSFIVERLSLLPI